MFQRVCRRIFHITLSWSRNVSPRPPRTKKALLFRQLSQDRKLLLAFLSAFVLAAGVATLSAFTEQSGLAVVPVSASWAVLLILGLFLYAYKRALRFINPVHQVFGGCLRSNPQEIP